VLVLFAVFASLTILFAAFVLDVGNWFEHQRHLQVQADAAALAAAQDFAYPCTPEVKEHIYKTAGQYGGAASVLTPDGATVTSSAPLFNEQIGGTLQSNIHELINAKKYYEQPSEDSTVVQAPPCVTEQEEKESRTGANMIDVKLTETNLPWFFKALNVPDVNAHARVSIRAESIATAVEPIIESQPIEARVFFVEDEPDGNDSNYNNKLIATALMTEPKRNEAKGTVVWSNASTPASVKITAAHIGVRIALAGKEGALKGTGNETLSVCGHVSVECFDEDSVIPPLLHIAGYSTENKGALEKPLARKVTLSAPAAEKACTEPYFSNYIGGPTCTFTISAAVEDGSATTTGITLTPEVVTTAGFGGGRKNVVGAAMKYEPSTGLWTGAAQLPSTPQENFGSSEINLLFKCEKAVRPECKKKEETTKEKENPLAQTTFKDVQRMFSAGPDGSNRIVGAWISEPKATETPVPKERGADSYPLCKAGETTGCTHELVVTVELSGSLVDAKKYSEAPYHIRFGDNDQDSDDQFVITCPPTTSESGAATKFGEHLAKGCQGKYKLNTTDPKCEAKTEPYDCVGLVEVNSFKGEEFGELTTLFQNSIAARVESLPTAHYYCPNNWTNNNGGAVPIIPANDSRLVQLFVVPFSVTNLRREPSHELPIENFATFYITGWRGDKCATDDVKSPRGPEEPRELVGHLIKYVNVLGEGTAFAKCSTRPESIETCVATLTQ
jgi:Putative Flp pilus-assembly TadE/G-like